MGDDAEKDWDRAWELYDEYGDTLLAVAQTLTGEGTPAEARDLVHGFALEKLPRLGWLTRDFDDEEVEAYLVSAIRNFVYDEHRKADRRERRLEDFQSFPSAEADSSIERNVEPDRFMNAVRDAAEKLSHEQRRALQLFLGLEGEPTSIRGVSRQMNASRYRARKLVQEALLGILSQLEGQQLLEEQQVRASRLVILQGMDWDEAAKLVGTTKHRLKETLRAAREAVVEALI